MSTRPISERVCPSQSAPGKTSRLLSGKHLPRFRSNLRWLRLAATSAALLLWLSAVAAPAACASSGERYALIFGTLWGAGDRPVYGVRVKLRRSDEKKFRWEAISDHRGEFAFRVAPAKADYVLVPDVKHSKDKPLPETSVHVEGDERVDVSVHLARE